MKVMKWVGYSVIALLAIALAAYWWLLVETHHSSTDRYLIDLAEIRRLGDLQAGAKPQSIRVESVAQLEAPAVFVTAGAGWKKINLAVSAYELVYRDRTVVIDTGLSAPIAAAMSAKSFDGAAFSRVGAALHQASMIALTHEHPDHVGGLLSQPDLARLLPAVRLTGEQLAELKTYLGANKFPAVHLSPAIFDHYSAVNYDRYQALAPGVVLIKAPGHTPGSQMVYVRRADGTEYLFLGDVAWQMANVERLREKARAASLFAGENRSEVRDELATLHQLHVDHPELHMMPGHDGAAIQSWVRQGLLQQGF